MALSPSPQPISRTSPWISPASCQAMTFSLGALVSHGGVVIGGTPWSRGLRRGRGRRNPSVVHSFRPSFNPRYSGRLPASISRSCLARIVTGRADCPRSCLARGPARLPGSSTSFNEPSREAEKEVRLFVGTSDSDRELMSSADVGRTVSRIAHQIIEKTALDGPDAPRVVLLGIPTRGTCWPPGWPPTSGNSPVSPSPTARWTSRSTATTSTPSRLVPLEDTSIPEGGIDGALVVLVDDVLYSGPLGARGPGRAA